MRNGPSPPILHTDLLPSFSIPRLTTWYGPYGPKAVLATHPASLPWLAMVHAKLESHGPNLDRLDQMSAPPAAVLACLGGLGRLLGQADTRVAGRFLPSCPSVRSNWII